jgi:phosphinothricin acetyltransferase
MEPFPLGDGLLVNLPAGCSLRPGCLDDLVPLWKLYNDVILEGGSTGHLDPLPIEDRREWLEEHMDPRYPMLVVEDSAGIAGYGTISPWRAGRRALDPTVEVSIYLAASARSMGIGRKLLTEFVSLARDLGHGKMIAIVFDTNAASLGLCESVGFERWGHIPDSAILPSGPCGSVVMGFDLLAPS